MNLTSNKSGKALDCKALVCVTSALVVSTSSLLTANVTFGTLGVPASPLLVSLVAPSPTHTSMSSVYCRHCCLVDPTVDGPATFVRKASNMAVTAPPAPTHSMSPSVDDICSLVTVGSARSTGPGGPLASCEYHCSCDSKVVSSCGWRWVLVGVGGLFCVVLFRGVDNRSVAPNRPWRESPRGCLWCRVV